MLLLAVVAASDGPTSESRGSVAGDVYRRCVPCIPGRLTVPETRRGPPPAVAVHLAAPYRVISGSGADGSDSDARRAPAGPAARRAAGAHASCPRWCSVGALGAIGCGDGCLPQRRRLLAATKVVGEHVDCDG